MSSQPHRGVGALPPTGPAVLGIGTATFIRGYGLAADDSAQDPPEALVRRALELGIRYVDTAAAYGDSEEILGDLTAELQSAGARIASKLKVRGGETASDLVDEIAASVRRLAIPRLDTVLIHSADSDQLGSKTTAEALEQARRDGLVARTGASTYGDSDATLAVEYPWCHVVQVEHSILNPSVVRALQPVVRRREVEVVVRSVFCKGLLTDRRFATDLLDRDLESRLDELERLGSSWGFSLPELAVRYALDAPGVDVVLVGVSTLAELELAASAAQRAALSQPQLRDLSEFDLSHHDMVHPERWQTFRSPGGRMGAPGERGI